MHIYDAIGTNYTLKQTNLYIDSAFFYDNLFAKHGINKAILDTTISYYSAHPGMFNKVYEKVHSELSKRENDVNNEASFYQDNLSDAIYNHYKQRFVKDSADYFEPYYIPVNDTGKYVISVSIRLHKEDESINPRISAYLVKDSLDSKNGESTIAVGQVPAIKSEFSREYNIMCNVADSTYKYLMLIIPEVDEQESYYHKKMQLVRLVVNKQES